MKGSNLYTTLLTFFLIFCLVNEIVVHFTLAV